ncbi:MAG: Anaerobic glycerol-3-phosphate dehydrogenase subunit B [Chloroflexi bacterium ADurb.Bin325]|nr:MAG: Anaerobic glycerol-3-phosphate dehydrogenase subunit B [Chloroflexi bacterium ADurb.Bin325]
MDNVLVIGAGPAGLLAAGIAAQAGARVRVLAAGIGTTHIMPGWLGVLRGDGELKPRLQALVGEQPEHPYALAGLDALEDGLAALRALVEPAGLTYVGDLARNFRLPTALGNEAQAAVVPASFAAGDLSDPAPMLIAGPAGWRDFYPALCAENLARRGVPARAAAFELPELHDSKFDATAAGVARLFDRPDVRGRVAAQIKAALNGAPRVGLPAVVGLAHHRAAWEDLQARIGAAVFEIPTLPPSVPGMRLFFALRDALTRMGATIVFDMEVARGLVERGRAVGVVVPNPSRDGVYRGDRIILATGGLYGGGITSDHHGNLREKVFGLPVAGPAERAAWFGPQFIPPAGGHAVHRAGLRADSRLRPLDEQGAAALDNVRIAGRLLAGYDPLEEGSTEGVWLATAYRAARAN